MNSIICFYQFVVYHFVNCAPIVLLFLHEFIKCKHASTFISVSDSLWLEYNLSKFHAINPSVRTRVGHLGRSCHQLVDLDLPLSRGAFRNK